MFIELPSALDIRRCCTFPQQKTATSKVVNNKIIENPFVVFDLMIKRFQHFDGQNTLLYKDIPIRDVWSLT